LDEMPPYRFDRADVTFACQGTACAAWLYRPAEAPEGLPLVVLGHGLGAVREMRLDAYAERFAQAGFAALVFDYRYLGASGGTPRQLLDIRKQLQDWHAAIEFARDLPGIDAERIVLWGSSFGGGHVMRIASEDPRLAAVIAQCPFTDGLSSLVARTRTNPVSALMLIVMGLVDLVGSRFGARPLLAPMAGTSWMPAFLASPDSLRGSTDLAPPGTRLSRRTSALLERHPKIRAQWSPNIVLSDEFFGKDMDTRWGVMAGPGSSTPAANAVSARLALHLPFYRPGRSLPETSMPILVCACDNDSVAPVQKTVRAAKGLANVEVIRYPYGHFDIYLGDAFERAVKDQIDFLVATLTDASAPEVSRQSFQPHEVGQSSDSQ
jgi:uncharacterized protein